jgi:isoleucyl-tRNA synthetase
MSVHFEEWPSSFPCRRESSLDTVEVEILEKMMVARKIVEFGLARRDEAGIKVRQPLAKAIVNGYDLDDDLTTLIKDELNVKEIVYSGKILTEILVTRVNENDKSLIENVGDVKKLIDNKNIVELDVVMTPELIAEGMKRELVRFINAERKNADLTIADRITLQIDTQSEAVKNAVKIFEADLKKDVLADEIIIGAVDGGKEVDVNGEKAIIKVIKR